MLGRYRFLSLSKSARGKKLLVRDIVMMNQNIENGSMGDNFLMFFKTITINANQSKTDNHLNEPLANQLLGKS
jgi:hypothetical protein